MGVHKVYVVVIGVIEHGVGSETVCDQVCFGMLCVRFVCVDMFFDIPYSSRASGLRDLTSVPPGGCRALCLDSVLTDSSADF